MIKSFVETDILIIQDMTYVINVMIVFSLFSDSGAERRGRGGRSWELDPATAGGRGAAQIRIS